MDLLWLASRPGSSHCDATCTWKHLFRRLGWCRWFAHQVPETSNRLGKGDIHGVRSIAGGRLPATQGCSRPRRSYSIGTEGVYLNGSACHSREAPREGYAYRATPVGEFERAAVEVDRRYR